MQAIGILGGTFDPVHNGHLYLATEIIQQFPFANIKLLPAFLPVHRALPTATASERLAMLHMAIQNLSGLSVDDREIQRGGPSYMIDTLISLRKEVGNTTPLWLIMAIDAFSGFSSWHQWETIPDYAHIFLVQRPGYNLQAANEKLTRFIAKHTTTDVSDLQKPCGHIYFSHIMGLPISSTQVRNLIAMHEDVGTLIPATVWQFIQKHKLYK